MISHVTVGSNDIARAKAFYQAVMTPLGYARVVEGEDYFAYGETAEAPPCFWVLPPFDGRPAERGNGWHCAFLAPSRAAVDAFHAAAVTPFTPGGSLRHGDDDFPLGMHVLVIAEGLGGFFQRAARIDHRPDLSGFNKLLHHPQTVGACLH